MTHLDPTIVQAAQQAAKSTGVPASISLAQFALESAWGTKITGTNNYFGIKAVKGQPFTEVWTHEFLNGKMVEEQQPFANYATPLDAFVAHGRLLSEDTRYASFMTHVRIGDIEGACNALTGVYATDPNYGQVVYHVIEADDLEQYDQHA
jgi:flagellum-specific peptidoglycan hydrolase FlgJ